MFGYPCELDELRAIADRHGLALIEDACESLGAEYRGRPLGSHGPAGGVRVLPEQADDDRRGRRRRHALGARSGGSCAACATRDARTTEAAAGSTTSASVCNYRWTDVQAAIGLGQLEKLDRILELRRRCRHALRRAPRPRSRASRRRHRTTPSTVVPGSSTSSSSPPSGSTARP